MMESIAFIVGAAGVDDLQLISYAVHAYVPSMTVDAFFHQA